MGLFGRRRRDGVAPQSPIREFWSWWGTSGESRFSEAIRHRDFGDLPAEMTSKVRAIHPDLQWETRKGQSSAHSLCVTAGGTAELRPLAERWLRAAPPASPLWEYSSSRLSDHAVVDSTLDISGAKVELGLARVGVQVDESRQLVDIAVFHPLFESLDKDVALQVSFLLADWLLGEDDVERWIGGVEAAAVDPQGSIPIRMFPEFVSALASRKREPTWILAESTTPGGSRLLISAVRPMKWIDNPLFDLHTEIAVPFSAQREDGLPTPEALELLRAYEDGLRSELGMRGVLVALETFDGKRVFHVYSDSEDQNSRDLIERFVAPWRAVTTHSPDPGWKQVRRFT